MSTPTLAPDRPPFRRRLLPTIVATLIFFFALFVIACTWFVVSARLALPQIEGTLQVSGLSAPVSVIRDAQGVPAIKAQTLGDLFFVQGYVTAQDRLWQMDMTRRYASGRLSEILGPSMVKSDIRQRTLLMPLIAQRAAAALSGPERGYIDAYARGVNAYIDSHRHSLPLEFHILHYEPQPWTAVDTLLVGESMSEMLNLENLQTALTREGIVARIGPELAADLYPNSSFRDHPPVPSPEPTEDYPEDPTSREESRARHHKHSNQHAELLPHSSLPDFDSSALMPGSNNWVVSGAHTYSGKPLLSNDMHLPHQIPNIWYEVHLTSGDFDVAGVSLPGVPFVIVGHNQRIAWGFTNVGAAVTDLYLEQLNAADQYLTPDGWKPLEHHREKIAVRWHKDVEIDVAVTRHGPIVTPLIPGEKRSLALKWTLFDPAASQVPFFDVDSARNWDEFRRAFSRFGSPSQNVVYADVDGHIGYQATGMIPLRPWAQASANPAPDAQDQPQSPSYTGLPLPGTDNSHEWAGYVPFDNLPSVFDPPSGIIATANGRITPNGYPHVLSTEWGPPYRTERIYRFLNTHKALTPADMLALQTDVYSNFDRFCAQRFVYAIDHSPNASVRAREAAESLRNWNGMVTTDSSPAAIVSTSRRELVRLLLEPKLGSDYDEYRWFMSSVWLENTILLQPQRWLPPGYSTFNDLLAAAVEKAVNAPHAPAKPSAWQWGEYSPVYIQHPLFGKIPFLRRWTGPGVRPQSGDGYTVKQVGRTFGPSERMTVDFANIDASTLNIVTGQSGNLTSPYFQDQWTAWYTGKTFILSFSDTAVQNAASKRLQLQPANNR